MTDKMYVIGHDPECDNEHIYDDETGEWVGYQVGCKIVQYGSGEPIPVNVVRTIEQFWMGGMSIDEEDCDSE